MGKHVACACEASGHNEDAKFCTFHDKNMVFIHVLPNLMKLLALLFNYVAEPCVFNHLHFGDATMLIYCVAPKI